MLSSLVLLSTLAISPVREFTDRYPRSSTIAASGGQRLVHASGFLFHSGAKRPEDAAAAFLDLHGAAFGVTPRQTLVVKWAPAAGEVGAVRFERRIDGLPIFVGDLVLGVDAQSRVFVVNGADVPPAVSGRHALGETKARSAAMSSFPGGARAGAVSSAKGWRAFGSAVRAVYRVDLVSEEPVGDWRVFVDGESGKALFREDRRVYAAATGNVFELSPMETLAAQCPISGNAHTECATTITPSLPNLTSATSLTGSQVTVYNCNGADFPANVPGAGCVQTATPDYAGTYNYAPWASTTDEFAAVMAYYHLDKHYTFLESLDPGALGGFNYNLPGYVNVYLTASPYPKPLDNAFFSGGLQAMFFGQGTAADFAYDSSVIYHEMTHAAVDAWGGFNPDIDALGGLTEPRAVNEGTADAMAASEFGRSQIGLYVAGTGTLGTPEPCLRDMNDPNASRTCQGDGTLVPQLGGAVTSLNGLDGEVHDDGEIWNGFYWEVYQGLKAAGVKACAGSCDAGPALQYKAVQLAGGTSPTFNSYWQTFKVAATALIPAQPGAATYVECVARGRKLDKCDRTFPLYAGESKLQYVDQELSSFQIVLSAIGSTTFAICSANGTTTTVYARSGSPVQIDPSTGAVTADGYANFARSCSNGPVIISGIPSGTWYLLLDSPQALAGSSPGMDIYRITASNIGMTSRPVPDAPPFCVPPFLVVTPQAASAPPRGSLTFAASGGSGEGYSWSLSTNASGGSVTAAGVYTAGPTGGVDYVQVADSAGNTSFAVVYVGQGVSVYPVTASIEQLGSLHFSANGGSGTGFTWSLTTNASGGNIDPVTGDYTAGGAAGVVDVVQATDSLGNVGTATVTIGAPPPSAGSKSGCGCGTSSGATPMLALGLAALMRRRRKSTEQSS